MFFLGENKRYRLFYHKSKQIFESREEYVRGNRENHEIDIKREHWEKFTNDMGHDLYGSLKKVWMNDTEAKKGYQRIHTYPRYNQGTMSQTFYQSCKRRNTTERLAQLLTV